MPSRRVISHLLAHPSAIDGTVAKLKNLCAKNAEPLRNLGAEGAEQLSNLGAEGAVSLRNRGTELRR